MIFHTRKAIPIKIAILLDNYTKENSIMNNKRQYARIPLPMIVEVIVEDEDPVIMKTRDVSDGGVFLENNDNIILQMGVKLTIKVVEDMPGGQPNEIPATVVRVTDDGFAVQFDLN